MMVCAGEGLRESFSSEAPGSQSLCLREGDLMGLPARVFRGDQVSPPC